jgi:hypothetical protein
MKKMILTSMLTCFLFSLSHASIIKWNGSAADEQWMNPLNWEGGLLPGAADDVWLDHSILQISYRVLLPTHQTITVRSLVVSPAPNQSIVVVILPSSTHTPALTCTGLVELRAGAVLHNQSGATSGLALQLLDSLRIFQDARYWHQTRTSHAAIVSRLSRMAETAKGIFELDVPGSAGYTVSITGRTYGSLYLSASGGPRSYTSNGASPLHIRGDWMIGPGVNYSIDLNNDVRVGGRFAHAGQILDLASQDNHTVYRLEGDVRVESQSTIRESALGKPVIEMAGLLHQRLDIQGKIEQEVTWRCNHSTLTLLSPWRIHYALQLLKGIVHSSPTAPIEILPGSQLEVDSLNGSAYIEGPCTRSSGNSAISMLFPVGSGKWQRWLQLANMHGRVTVQYMRFNPLLFGALLDPELVQISSLEYWKASMDLPQTVRSPVTLSYHPAFSGNIIMPAAMRVAQWDGIQWRNRGNSYTAQQPGQGGSVQSTEVDWSSGNHIVTLATTDLANVLPWTNPIRRPATTQPGEWPWAYQVRASGQQLFLDIQAPKAAQVGFSVYDIQGKRYLQQIIRVQKGPNVVQIPFPFTSAQVYLGAFTRDAHVWKTIPFILH